MQDPTVRARQVGHLFNTITNGIRNMPAYGSQIDEADRWAIVAYVRALQLSQHAPIQDVPPEIRSTLR
jgi:mono/diheme cytochrome c family protein